MGCFVPGCSGGGTGFGRSAWRLYHAVGISFSLRNTRLQSMKPSSFEPGSLSHVKTSSIITRPGSVERRLGIVGGVVGWGGSCTATTGTAASTGVAVQLPPRTTLLGYLRQRAARRVRGRRIDCWGVSGRHHAQRGTDHGSRRMEAFAGRGFAGIRRPGRFPIPAYSEFMPPPRLGRKPYGADDPVLFDEDDPLGWHVTEYEEAMELRPGLEHLAGELIRALEHLGHGRPAHGIARAKLEGNPYWPDELAEHAGRLPHERYVAIAPLALSRTQDDKGRVRWTLFGGSEQGPARAFWKGFFTAPGCEVAAEEGLGFFRRLLAAAYGEPPERARATCTRPASASCPGWAIPRLPYAQDGRIAVLDEALSADRREAARAACAICSRFGPSAACRRRSAGPTWPAICTCCPFPAAWCSGARRRISACGASLPLAMQIPLLHSFPRHEHPMQSARAAVGLDARAASRLMPARRDPEPGLPACANTYRRTHRWAPHASARGRAGRGRRRRPRGPRAVQHGARRPGAVRQADGPQRPDLDARFPPAAGRPARRRRGDPARGGRRCARAGISAIASSSRRCRSGGTKSTGIGRWWRIWRRRRPTPEVLPDAPLGYLTAYPSDRPNAARADRALAAAAGPAAARGGARTAFAAAPEHHEHHVTIHNVRKLLDACELWGEPLLPAGFARALLTMPKQETLEDWLGRVGELGQPRRQAGAGRGVAAANWPEPSHQPLQHGGKGDRHLLREPCTDRRCGPFRQTGLSPVPPLTYHRTATRPFETAYWRTIARLAHGRYVNKDNADCVRDPVSQSLLEASPSRPGGAGRLSAGLLPPDDREGGHDGQGGRRRSAVPLADRFPFPLVGRLAGQPGRQARRARPGGGHSRPRPPPGGDHGRPLRHGLHGRPLREGPRRQRRPAGRGRGRRQPLGHRRPDARRADLPGTQPSRPAGLRRLAGAPDRRGVSLRLHGRPAPGPGVVEGTLQAPPARRPAARSLAGPRSRASTCST